MNQNRILFTAPYQTGRETPYVNDVMASGATASEGPYTKACTQLLREITGSQKVLLTPSCTAALELSAMLLNLQEGDEVIMPSFTFVSTANAFVLRGATPVFVDIDAQTGNLDPQCFSAAITDKTKAVVPVHYAGVPCDMVPILRAARANDVVVIEDAAQALCSTYREKPAGQLADMAAFSFHSTKNFGCGEGGALTIDRADFVERAEILREKGTNRSLFLRGQVDKYTWVDVGSSLLSTELSSAFLLGQLEGRAEIQQRRERVYAQYKDGLAKLAAMHLLTLPLVPDDVNANAHIFYVLAETEEKRNGLIAFLRDKDIQATFHYVPLHLSAMGRKVGRVHGKLDVTESFAQRLVRLPLHPGLSENDVERVIDEVHHFYGKAR